MRETIERGEEKACTLGWEPPFSLSPLWVGVERFPPSTISILRFKAGFVMPRVIKMEPYILSSGRGSNVHIGILLSGALGMSFLISPTVWVLVLIGHGKYGMLLGVAV
jgi:hypothetical protein